MKRNKLDLLFPAIGVFIIIKSFLNGATTTNLFGAEINIWIYRGIWLVMIFVGLYRYLNSNKTPQN